MTQLFLTFEPSDDPESTDEPGPPRIVPDAGVLIRELQRIARHGPRRRRVLVTDTRGEGKELLRQVALRGTSWLGFEVSTIRPLAVQLAAPALAAKQLHIVDEFEEQELMEQAIDDVLLSSTVGRFRPLVEKVGFRDAVRNSIAALRLGGVHVGRLAVAKIDDEEKQALITSVLGSYEHLLETRKAADTALVLETAAEAVSSAGCDPVGDRDIFLAPGLPKRGSVGRLVKTLIDVGAQLLKTDSVEGLSVPEGLIWDVAPPESPFSYLHAVDKHTGERPGLELFSASSIYDELRGVLRRVVSGGIPWDDVEIVTPDPATYGSALHALAMPLNIPVTFAVGLPVERTRPGRVLAGYFRWIESGYQEPVFRALLDAGDLAAPAPRDWIAGPSLARALRGLRIGWGRDRYLPAVKRALVDVERLVNDRYASDELFEKQRERKRQTLEALRSILAPVLKATPLSAEATQASPSQVAAGAAQLLQYVAPGTDADETASLRLGRILERIRATLMRETESSSAMAIVRGYLEIRIPAPRTEGAAPWSASPGSLHLTDLEHGGATGRGHTFIVGMDSSRFPGGALEDPLLRDRERWSLGRGELPVAADRLAERRFLFARLFARLRGRVSLSYARWDPSQARALNPAPELLQALRLREGDTTLGFDDLDEQMGQAESRIPATMALALDGDDVWMSHLALSDGRLLDGEALVRKVFPGLNAGFLAREAIESGESSPYLGILPEGAEAWDPRANSERAVSASGLGDLGTCPRRYFFKYILGVRPPDDPEFDPGRWLDPLRRGSLLHSVFERALGFARDEGLSYEDDRFLEGALAFLEKEAVAMMVVMPTPSDAVREWETEALRTDVRSFVTMIRAQNPKWIDLEIRFGFDGEKGSFDAGGKPIHVRGAIDRVDDMGIHLRVVDYKTGSYGPYDAKTGVYDRGRRLQHMIYAAVAAARYGRTVGTAEYHFPTRKGENRTRTYSEEELQHGGDLVAKMLDGIKNGWFPPTDEPRDCSFCDYKDNCGASSDRWRKVTSPLTGWSKRNLSELESLSVLRAVRNWEDEEPVL